MWEIKGFTPERGLNSLRKHGEAQKGTVERSWELWVWNYGYRDSLGILRRFWAPEVLSGKYQEHFCPDKDFSYGRNKGFFV